METTARRRVALYAAGVFAAGSIAYAGWFRSVSADGDTLLSCAQAELQFGLLTSAQLKARQVLETEPTNLHALLIDAHCRSRTGDADGARASYARALAEGSPDANVAGEIRVQLALDALNLGTPALACQWLDGATGLTNAEARVKVHNVKGTALEAAGQPAAAAASHAAALAETCPEELSLLVDSARRLGALGQYRGAIEGLERQMQHLTENISRARTHYELAKLKLDAGLADSAREHLCHLRDLPRAQLAGDLARDAGYWKTKIGRGDVPAELGNLVSSSGSERDVK